MNILDKIKQDLEKDLKKISLLKHENIQQTLRKPPQSSFGDLSTGICFKLAKKLKKSPNQIAEEISKKIKLSKKIPVSKFEAKDGYINFFFDYEKLSELTLKTILKQKEKYGSSKKKKEKIMIEFSQPNTNKPMHIGHARNTFLGDSLSNILEFSGYKITRANYLGDTGLHIAKVILMYKMFGKNKKPDIKPDHFIGNLYIKFEKEAKKNPDLTEEAKEILRRYEQEDKEIIKIWKKLREWALKGLNETYRRLKIKFDVDFFESEFEKEGKEYVKKLLEKKIAHKLKDGAVVADLEKYGLPSTIILRADGTALYHTKDLALGIKKFEKYKIDRSIYVVGSEQKMYLKQIFKMIELLGYKKANQCYHLPYGLVMLPEGKMSSRKGNAVLLDNMLNELKHLAYKKVEKNNPNLSAQEKNIISEKIAIGALKYALVKISPERNVLFNKKDVIKFEGNTGPYLQYSNVRINSILKKAKRWKQNLKNEKLTKQEKKLINKLIEFPIVVEKASSDYRPHYICNYIYELSTIFNEFYHACPVIKSEQKDFRLTLTKATGIVIENGLNLLGIEIPNKM